MRERIPVAMRRGLIAFSVIAAIIVVAVLLSVAEAPQTGAPVRVAVDAAAVKEVAMVSAMSFVKARPGQRERLERFLKANWLALDQQALEQKKIKAYHLLRADADVSEKSWDFAVVIDYASREAMAAFVPFYITLARERAHVRIDGLDFADLGEVVQQKVVEPVDNEPSSGSAIHAQ